MTQLLTPQNIILAALFFIWVRVLCWTIGYIWPILLADIGEEFFLLRNWRQRRLINYNEYLNNGNQREVSFF